MLSVGARKRGETGWIARRIGFVSEKAKEFRLPADNGGQQEVSEKGPAKSPAHGMREARFAPIDRGKYMLRRIKAEQLQIGMFVARLGGPWMNQIGRASCRERV